MLLTCVVGHRNTTIHIFIENIIYLSFHYLLGPSVWPNIVLYYMKTQSWCMRDKWKKRLLADTENSIPFIPSLSHHNMGSRASMLIFTIIKAWLICCASAKCY
ncbi:hypothetical protein ACJW31_09G153500 [Castanea mollissima]